MYQSTNGVGTLTGAANLRRSPGAPVGGISRAHARRRPGTRSPTDCGGPAAVPPQGDLSSVGFEGRCIADPAGAGDCRGRRPAGSVRNKRPFLAEQFRQHRRVHRGDRFLAGLREAPAPRRADERSSSAATAWSSANFSRLGRGARSDRDRPRRSLPRPASPSWAIKENIPDRGPTPWHVACISAPIWSVPWARAAVPHGCRHPILQEAVGVRAFHPVETNVDQSQFMAGRTDRRRRAPRPPAATR